MREGRQPGSNSNPNNYLQALRASALGAVQIERIFRPEELDVDDLAEAVRALLEHGGAAPPLLSVAPRGTAAKRIDVDPGKLARWERGEREPAGVLLNRVERFLDEAEAELGARWVG